MMKWMTANPYAVQAIPGPFHLLQPFPDLFSRRRPVRAAKALPNDFPDYLVFVTHNSLSAMTTTLADLSGEVHAYLVKLNYALAMERMMRSIMMWGMPGATPSPVNLTVLQSWFPQQPAPQPKQLSYWGVTDTSQPVAKPNAAYCAKTAATPEANDGFASACTAMMSLPAAMMNAAPAMMEAWGWNKAAAA
jgi:hypothetical protein